MTKATSHDLTVYELVTWILLRQACWRRSSKSINRKTPDKLASSRVSRNINKEGSLIAIKTSGGNFRVELQTAGVGGVKVRQRNCFLIYVQMRLIVWLVLSEYGHIIPRTEGSNGVSTGPNKSNSLPCLSWGGGVVY